MSTSRTPLSLAACLALVPCALAAQEPTLELRLERLAEELESARVEAHVPGMSIAIVSGDEVVFARGFGLAEVETERPADAETIYAIGSTTKAFTATLVGTLVDEGTLRWDDPASLHLPYFELAVRSEDQDAACTLRDLLSHRHGFARMSMLWMGGALSREEILRTAVGAEPWDDFRAGFHYCNVAYLAAGVAAGAADGSTWDELMTARILEPLAMGSTTLTTAAALEDARLAKGYAWDGTAERFEPRRMIELQPIGPAGSINSNVLDMAQWLRLQLGRGALDGMRIISEASLRETWTPQIEIAGGVSYGLGWMLREHDGRALVEHGGNIDGFSAQVGLCPEEDLGFVLLMNLDVSPLQQASLGLVFDVLLGEESPVVEASLVAAPEALEDYEGIYVANFATFEGEQFEVLLEDGALALDIPSQQTFELEPPDEEGRWSFAITDQIAVTFERDRAGRVVGLTVHQNGYSFEVPREGVELVPEVPAEVLEKYTGTFVRDRGGKQVQVTIENGRLTLNNRGQKLAFHTPGADGHAPLRARADQGATFAVDAEGRVDSFVFHGDAGDRTFTRVADTPATDLPTLEELFELRGNAARSAAQAAGKGARLTGEVWVAQSGVRGTVELFTQGKDRYANHMDFGKLGRIDAAARGGEAWRRNPMRGLQKLSGVELGQALLENPGAAWGDWREHFDTITVVRNDSLEGRAVHVVRLEKGGLPSRSYWVDAERGDVLQSKQTAVEGSVRIPVTVRYSDFQVVDGIRRAMRVEVENPATGRMVLTFDGVETGLELGDEQFTLEDSAAERVEKD